MSNGWDFNTKTNNTTYNKIEYTKFPVGITRLRIVDEGAPHIRWAHWFQPSKRYITCPGMTCPICEIRRRQKQNNEAITHSITRRFSINVINRESGKHEILEQGVGFFEEVKEMKDSLVSKGLDLIDSDITVKRRGTGQDDTSYRIDLGETSHLTKTEEKLLEKRIDFAEHYKPHEPAQIIRLLNGEKWEDVFYKNNDENNNSSDEGDEEVEIK